MEYEYAVKYLEYLGIEPTKKNITIILAMAPFKECRITPGWESSGDVASTFNIYPPSKVKKTQSVFKESNRYEKFPEYELPPIKEKKPTKIETSEDKKVEQGESSGIPKLTIEVIRKRYLYPFSINSNV